MTLFAFYALSAVVIISSGLAAFGILNDVRIVGTPVTAVIAVIACVIDWFVMMDLMRGRAKPGKKGTKTRKN